MTKQRWTRRRDSRKSRRHAALQQRMVAPSPLLAGKNQVHVMCWDWIGARVCDVCARTLCAEAGSLPASAFSWVSMP